MIGAHNIGYSPNEAELSYVRKAWNECSAFVTVCGGVEVPRLAGILEGKTATGPRLFLNSLRQRSPGVNWVEKRWVQDGKLWTSGALMNGADLIINFGKHYWGNGNGEGSLIAFAQKLGSWPDRDVDYKDVPWAM